MVNNLLSYVGIVRHAFIGNKVALKRTCGRGPVIESKQGLILFTSTLEIILNKTFHKLMGLNSFRDVGLSIFGIGTIRVSTNLGGKSSIAKAFATSCQTSSPTILQ